MNKLKPKKYKFNIREFISIISIILATIIIFIVITIKTVSADEYQAWNNVKEIFTEKVKEISDNYKNFIKDVQDTIKEENATNSNSKPSNELTTPRDQNTTTKSTNSVTIEYNNKKIVITPKPQVKNQNNNNYQYVAPTTKPYINTNSSDNFDHDAFGKKYEEIKRKIEESRGQTSTNWEPSEEFKQFDQQAKQNMVDFKAESDKKMEEFKKENGIE